MKRSMSHVFEHPTAHTHISKGVRLPHPELNEGYIILETRPFGSILISHPHHSGHSIKGCGTCPLHCHRSHTCPLTLHSTPAFGVETALPQMLPSASLSPWAVKTIQDRHHPSGVRKVPGLWDVSCQLLGSHSSPALSSMGNATDLLGV